MIARAVCMQELCDRHGVTLPLRHPSRPRALAQDADSQWTHARISYERPRETRSRWILTRGSAVLRRAQVSLAAAALQFPLAHPVRGAGASTTYYYPLHILCNW